MFCTRLTARAVASVDIVDVLMRSDLCARIRREGRGWDGGKAIMESRMM